VKKAIFYFYEALRLSWQAIRSHKLRTLLTMLGISIGIFSITMIFTLVNTLQYSVTLNLSSLGSTILYVHNWPWKDNSEDWYKYFNRPKVSLMDYEKLNSNTLLPSIFLTSKTVLLQNTKKILPKVFKL